MISILLMIFDQLLLFMILIEGAFCPLPRPGYGPDYNVRIKLSLQNLRLYWVFSEIINPYLVIV